VADEAQNYSTEALIKGITEGRSMGLRILAAAQYAELFPATVRLAFAKNVAYQLTCQRVTNPQTGRESYAIELIPMQQTDPETGKPPVWQLAALPPLPNRREEQLTYIR